MGFPFLAPLSPWTVEVLKEREESTFDTAFRNPYVILTSGALVVKGIAKSEQDARNEEIKDLINTPPNYPNAYKGCIISNNSNKEKNYSLKYFLGESKILLKQTY